MDLGGKVVMRWVDGGQKVGTFPFGYLTATVTTMNKDLKELTRRPVWVEWVDSKMTHGWSDPDDVNTDNLEIITLGFLIGEDVHAIQVSSSASATGCASSVLTIPQVAITKMEEISF